MTRKSELVNVLERSLRYNAFKIPAQWQRDMLYPGDRAKLIFKFKDSDNDIGCVGERMWVKVLVARDGNDFYEGELLNQPVSIEDIGQGIKAQMEGVKFTESEFLSFATGEGKP